MDLSFLAPVYHGAGPYASVVLDTTRATEKATHEIELRWRDLRQQLQSAGADERTLGALDTNVGRDVGVPGQHGQALFAAGGEVRLQRELPAPPTRDTASCLPVPDPLPLLVTLQHVVPYVLVVADRTGADIFAYGPHGRTAEPESVEGDQDPGMQKIQGGDDANKQYQRRAENIWAENAEKVAEEVGTLVHQMHAGLLVLAGDPRAREKLESHLDPHSKEIVSVVEEGARAAGASEGRLREDVDQLVKQAADRQRADAVSTLERERGRVGAAAEGLTAVVRAFQRAQVDTLFVPEEASYLPHNEVKLPPGSAGDAATSQAPHGATPLPEGGNVTLWIADDLGHVAQSREDLLTIGSGEPRQAPALPALVRAAYATEANLILVPADTAESFTEGVACVLRWSDPSTTEAAS